MEIIKDVDKMSNKVISDCNDEFERLFLIEMGKISGDDRLNEIKDITLFNKRICRKGYNLHSKLQNEIRLFLGNMFSMGYYILVNETTLLNRMKNSDLSKNDYLYGYLMKCKNDKSIKLNYLFYNDGNGVKRVVFNSKLDYRMRSKYDKEFFKFVGDEIDINKYKLLENLTNTIYDYINLKYRRLSTSFYNQEYKKYKKMKG